MEVVNAINSVLAAKILQPDHLNLNLLGNREVRPTRPSLFDVVGKGE
jgi:hypothetical protein